MITYDAAFKHACSDTVLANVMQDIAHKLGDYSPLWSMGSKDFVTIYTLALEALQSTSPLSKLKYGTQQNREH